MGYGAILSNWRRRGFIILWLWAAAAALIAVQAIALSAAATEYRVYVKGLGGIPRIPADWWRVTGALAPLVCVAIALWLQRSWQSVWLRKLSKTGLVLLVPITLLALLLAAARGPSSLDSVRLPSGKRFVLAVEPIPTDTVYTLYQPIGRFGFWWRHVANLDYSEDGRFTGGERIVLSPDAKWLTVARVGLWTDCFRLVNDQPFDCRVSVSPNWNDANFERDMKARSTEIQRMTGMMPPQEREPAFLP